MSILQPEQTVLSSTFVPCPTTSVALFLTATGQMLQTKPPSHAVKRDESPGTATSAVRPWHRTFALALAAERHNQASLAPMQEM